MKSVLNQLLSGFLTTPKLILLSAFLFSCSAMPSDYEKHLAEKSLEATGGGIAGDEPSARTGQKQYSNGDVYRGDLKGGAPHGSGVLTKSEGGSYRGEFREGLMHGEGKLVTPGGSTYIGHFEGEEFHGQGKLVYPNGETREGRFARGDFVEGKAVGKQGETFLGTIRGAVATGTFTSKNGDRSSGTFMTAQDAYSLHGQGSHEDKKTGTLYEGTFTQGTKNGGFITTLSNGVQLSQNWVAGRLTYQTFGGDYLQSKRKGCKVGNGDWILVSGKCNNGVMDGPVVVVYKDSSAELDAVFKNGVGSGTLKKRSGALVRGTFNQSVQPHGEKITVLDGEKIAYFGGYKNGRRSGDGVCYRSDGSGVACEYKAGKRIDAVYLAQNMTRELQSLAAEHQSFVAETVDADIKAQRNSIDRRYHAKVKSLEKELSSYSGWQTAGAVAGALAEGFQTGDIDDRHAIELEEKKARKKREIEAEKARYRRDLESQERAWASRRANQLDEYVARYSDKYDAVIEEYKTICDEHDDRLWKDNLCIPKAGLIDDQVSVLNDLLSQQHQSDAGARNTNSRIANKLDTYQRDSSQRWSNLNRVARAENEKHRRDAEASARWNRRIAESTKQMQDSVAQSRAETQAVIDNYNEMQEEEYRRKASAHEQRQQAVARQNERAHQAAVAKRQTDGMAADEAARKEDTKVAAAPSAPAPAVSPAPYSYGGSSSSPSKKPPRSVASDEPKVADWESNRLMACGVECEVAVLLELSIGVTKEDAIKACETGCGKMHLESKMVSAGWKINCEEVAGEIPDYCAQETGSLAQYCLKAFDIWRDAIGCTDSKGW